MKKPTVSYLIFFFFLHTTPLYSEGFFPNTIVKTPSGYFCIEKLKSTDLLLSHCINNFQYHPLSVINEIGILSADFFIQITIDNSKICCAPNQKFYSYNQQQWIRADKLTLADLLMDNNGKAIIIESLEYIQQSCTFHTLTLAANHTYYVSEHNIIAHNALPFMIASTVVIESVIAPIIKTCLTVGTTLLGVYFAKKKLRQHYAGNIDSHSSSSNYDSYYPDPNDPNNDDKNKKNEHPHGIYRDAPYHHKNSRGKSKCPNDGQRCLDYSLPTETNQRVSIEGKEFVVLRYTCPGEYHGFKVSWENLHEELRQVLIDNGYVRKSGKIIRQITEKYLK